MLILSIIMNSKNYKYFCFTMGDVNLMLTIRQAAAEYPYELEWKMFLKTGIQSYGLWNIGKFRTRDVVEVVSVSY